LNVPSVFRPTKSKYEFKAYCIISADLDLLGSVEVEYLVLPGWKTKTDYIRNFVDLPLNAQNYLKAIEKKLQVPVKWIGVGQARDSVISVY